MADAPGVTRIARDWNNEGGGTLTVEVNLPPPAVLMEAGARRRERCGSAGSAELDGLLGYLEETLKRIG